MESREQVAKWLEEKPVIPGPDGLEPGVHITMAELIELLALIEPGEPVAWRWRVQNAHTGTMNPWHYAEDRPDRSSPDTEVHPLYLSPPQSREPECTCPIGAGFDRRDDPNCPLHPYQPSQEREALGDPDREARIKKAREQVQKQVDEAPPEADGLVVDIYLLSLCLVDAAPQSREAGEGVAWLVVEMGSEIKCCPMCGGLALEGEEDCKACGHHPEDDASWRVAGHWPKKRAPWADKNETWPPEKPPPESREREALRKELTIWLHDDVLKSFTVHTMTEAEAYRLKQTLARCEAILKGGEGHEK